MQPISPSSPPVAVPRPYGLCAGEFTVPDDFDDPLPDLTIASVDPAVQAYQAKFLPIAEL
jgi:hypothetical protein